MPSPGLDVDLYNSLLNYQHIKILQEIWCTARHSDHINLLFVNEMTSPISKVEERYGQLGETRLHFEDDTARRQSEKRTSVTAASSLWLWLQGVARYVLLPQGFPDSVSDDYLEYQMWDTLQVDIYLCSGRCEIYFDLEFTQAFCSYLSGTLTTKAIMQGVGVGDAAATPLAATLTWILRDGTGMVGRILFATWKGYNLVRESYAAIFCKSSASVHKCEILCFVIIKANLFS